MPGPEKSRPRKKVLKEDICRGWLTIHFWWGDLLQTAISAELCCLTSCIREYMPQKGELKFSTRRDSA